MFKCSDCGNTELKREGREVFCSKCGLIIEDDTCYLDITDTYQTAHEPLNNGLTLNKEMASIERQGGWISPSKRKYHNIKNKYYNLFADKLLKLGFCESEAWDIFNYNFIEYYNANVDSKNRRKRTIIIDDYLNSLEFDKFNIKGTVSKINLQDNLKILGFYDNIIIIP